MCWSGEASAVLAVSGFAGTVYFYRKGESKVLCAALGYFSLMELLQAYTYTVVDQCYNPANQIATLLGYLHIAFQPVFINAVSLYFAPKELREKFSKPVYKLCLFAAFVFLMRLYPFEYMYYCYELVYTFFFAPDFKFAMPFCGEQICSNSGDWHISWQIPANGSALMACSYIMAAFLLPLLYGSWKMTIYHFIGLFNYR